MSLLASLHDSLTDSQCPIGLTAFLHRGDNIAAFIRLTQTNALLIARGPGAICQFVSGELDRQGVRPA